MRLLKPSWLHHDGNPILSIHIHPDDTRVVTGGQGNDSVGRVVIWNMQPILSKEEDPSVPKLLCQLDHHNACVNCVRWSNSGKYLCSGGDDRVIIIWKLVSKYSGNLNSSSSAFQNSAFGKTNLEQWKTLSMLRSHTGDVLDLAWSPGDKYLASASVDNTVIVWDAQNFPQIITNIKGHDSLVKGVTWDPVGKYLASQSDDKSLKIWRVSDWELENCVQEPFVECGGTTHVLRLDWSPDGSYLVSAHAMNGGGPTAQIIERTEWKTDKDFVGHRKAVVCVKFNGNIMQSDKSRMKHCCVALGSRDRSVSIWSTALKRPLVVIKDLFNNSIMDMSWSSCGTVMMACSFDGSVSVAQFSWKEIGKPLSVDEKANFYQKLYGKSVASTENCDIIQNLEVFLAKSNAIAAQSSTNNSEANLAEAQHLKPPPPPVIKGPTDKQIETRTADGRRRITPKFLLPPTEAEQANVPKSGQAIFMQVKGKDDVVSNSQTTAQDWRKSMVSSIENVKGFVDPVPSQNSKVCSDVDVRTEESVVTTNGNIANNENSNGTPNIGNNKSGTSEANSNGTEPMDVDSAKEEIKTPSLKLVNGNGVGHLGSAGESGDDSRTKTDDGASKEELLNGGMESDREGKTVGDRGANTEMRSGSENVVMNGGLGESDTVKESNKDGKAEPGKTQTDGVVNAGNAAASLPSTSSAVRKDAPPSVVPSVSSVTGQTVNLIAVRKKVKQPPEDLSKAAKKVKLVTPDVPSSSTETKAPEFPRTVPLSSSIVGGSSMLLGAPKRVGVTGTSPSRLESSKTHHPHHRLPPMKAESVLHLQVNPRPECSYSLQVTNHNKRPDGTCHQLVCSHSNTSLNGLEWTMCTDAPICGLTGDVHRIVIVCENATAHVLDIKGRYVFPPIMLSGQPSKTVLSGPFLVIVTSKAIINVWNIHTKSVVLKAESLLPLLTHPDSEKDRAVDISRIQVAAGGLPIIVLNTGRTFMYSAELTTWFLISDPRGLVSSPLVSSTYDQSLSSRMMLFTGDGRLRSKPEPAVVSHIKLKLATNMEMKNPEGIKQWMIALAKSLATHGLEKELHQLCEDLLGPTHSAARFSAKWVPKIIGVIDKRKLLRQILTLLLEDLKYQDLYSEFDEMLRELESHNENDMSSTAAAPSTNSTS